MELLSLSCTACGESFQIGTALAGGRVACPNCRELVTAPPIATPPQAEPTPPPLPDLDRAGPEPAAPPVQSPPQAAKRRRVLTPKERAQRRFTRNLILWIVCLAVLIAALVLLR